MLAPICTGMQSTPVTVTPSTNLQRAIDSSPEGTHFLLRKGVYRGLSVRPRNGNTFTGEDGAVVNGSRILSGFQPEGGGWIVDFKVEKGQRIGLCDDSRPLCTLPEQLFLDGRRLEPVDTRTQLGPGRWMPDYAHGQVLIADDPSGHTVEISVDFAAFVGAASNVTISNLTIEKYANPAQHGAIHGKEGTIGAASNGWTIRDCDIRLNHGAGIAVGNRMRIVNNRIHNNGQVGIVGDAGRSLSGLLIEGNEISANNQAGFQGGWEAGGLKLLHTSDVTIRGNRVLNNFGPGLWLDSDNIRTIYEDNIVDANHGIGIFHEVSYDAVMRNNTVRNNGTGWDKWLWGAQILIAASSNVEVVSNIVEVAAHAGDGICLIQQDRGSGRYGPHIIRNVRVHSNQITFRGSVGNMGGGGNYLLETLFGEHNVFDRNTYYLANPSHPYWHWSKGPTPWEGFRREGQEVGGTAKQLPLK